MVDVFADDNEANDVLGALPSHKQDGVNKNSSKVKELSLCPEEVPLDVLSNPMLISSMPEESPSTRYAGLRRLTLARKKKKANPLVRLYRRLANLKARQKMDEEMQLHRSTSHLEGIMDGQNCAPFDGAFTEEFLGRVSEL